VYTPPGCAGLAIFGTNSEANWMSVGEKRRLLEELIKFGVPAAALMPGTGRKRTLSQRDSDSCKQAGSAALDLSVAPRAEGFSLLQASW